MKIVDEIFELVVLANDINVKVTKLRLWPHEVYMLAARFPEKDVDELWRCISNGEAYIYQIKLYHREGKENANI